LRFREFKLGLAECHMALCAYAREAFMKGKGVIESRGYTLIHGIIDSFYFSSEGMIAKEVESVRKEIEETTALPLETEGIFKWVVFLTSRNDLDRPVPARYFGVFSDGTIKARGIEVRERSSPYLVKKFQQRCLECMSKYDSKEEIIKNISELFIIFEEFINKKWSPEELLLRVCIGRKEYIANVPQKKLITALKKKGIVVPAGNTIQYIMAKEGPCILADYSGNCDVQFYTKLLARSLDVLIVPFGFTIDKTCLVREITVSQEII
jgi:DNA polymerase elongation subunit (family B)